MSLEDVIASVERSERRLTVFNPSDDRGDDGSADQSGDSDDQIDGQSDHSDRGARSTATRTDDVVDELAERLTDRNVTVERKTTTSGRPVDFSVLEMDGVVLSTFDVESLRSFLDGSASDTPGPGFEPSEDVDLLRHLQEATFTSLEREQMFQATREIEDRAFRIGRGDLRAGFQTMDRFRDQRERYVELAKRGLDVTAYATPTTEDDPQATADAVTIVRSDDSEIADHWFVAYDGAGEPTQKCALLAEARSDGFYGFWTYDPDVVDWIIRHLEQQYG